MSWGAALAADRSYRVLRCAPARSEADLSFAALSDLLEDALTQRTLSSLPEPLSRALETALLRAEPEGTPVEPRAIGQAVLETLRLLATDTPVLLAIDDEQGLDRPSAAAIEFACRRLRGQRVALILARRTGGAERGAGLAEALPRDWLRRVELSPLSLGAIHTLLRQRLGAAFARPTLRRVHEESGGNPLFAIELARALQERGLRTTPGEPLPLPADLELLLRERLAGLPPGCTEPLAAAAALSDARVELIEAATTTDATDRLRAAIDARVIESDGYRVRFAHPLLASTAYTRMDRRLRRELHSRLAAVVSDPEERSRHLALSLDAPDADAALAIERAAELVAARAAPHAAAELCEHAHRLTPVENADDACRRQIAAGWYHFVAGDGTRARTLLEAAVAARPRGPVHALALLRLAWLGHHEGNRRTAAGLYAAALEEAGDDERLRAEIHEGLAWCVYLTREDMPTAARHAVAAVTLCERLDDPVLLADALAVQAQTEFMMGGGLPSPAMERALEIAAGTSDLRVLHQPLQHAAVLLLAADELDAARANLEEVRERALTQSDESALPWVLMRLSHVDLLAGRWPQAQALAGDAHELALQAGLRPLCCDLLCTRGLIHAHMGDAEEARTAVREGMAVAAEVGAGIAARLGPWALGLLELSAGDPALALEHLEPLRAASEAAGIVEPGENRYLGDLIEALIELDRLSEAERLVAELDERAASLRRTSALAVAGRCRGLALAARGDLPAATESIERALGEQPIAFERARTLLALGRTQRRAKQRAAARETLTAAAREFELLGAALFAAKAHAELGRIGGRASVAGLTPSEQRLTELVAEGRSNKEVAAALFVTPKTVETKLTRIYAKLGVSSRVELTRRLLDDRKL